MDTKNKFVKLHTAADAKSMKASFSFRITKGNVHDIRKYGPLVREAAEKYNINKFMQRKS
jgi:hypothetical protein